MYDTGIGFHGIIVASQSLHRQANKQLQFSLRYLLINPRTFNFKRQTKGF
jgi:hypothetical protein